MKHVSQTRLSRVTAEERHGKLGRSSSFSLLQEGCIPRPFVDAHLVNNANAARPVDVPSFMLVQSPEGVDAQQRIGVVGDGDARMLELVEKDGRLIDTRPIPVLDPCGPHTTLS